MVAAVLVIPAFPSQVRVLLLLDTLLCVLLNACISALDLDLRSESSRTMTAAVDALSFTLVVMLSVTCVALIVGFSRSMVRGAVCDADDQRRAIEAALAAAAMPLAFNNPMKTLGDGRTQPLRTPTVVWNDERSAPNSDDPVRSARLSSTANGAGGVAQQRGLHSFARHGSFRRVGQAFGSGLLVRTQRQTGKPA